MNTPRVAYVALVWPRSTIFAKTIAQQTALRRMAQRGDIAVSFLVDCSTDPDGYDIVESGAGKIGRFRRAGRLHSVFNLAWAYPQLYLRMYREILQTHTQVLYLRKPPVFDITSVIFMAGLRRRGVRVVMEVPTYPYDAEKRAASLLAWLDRVARRFAPISIDAIATFSQHAFIFGVPCVNIENGADLHLVQLAFEEPVEPGIRATVVAALEPWHRVDRILSALIGAWEQGDCRISRLNVVGEGPELPALKALVQSSKEASARTSFHGLRYGRELDAILAQTELAVGNLEESGERGIGSAQALKHREYTARGLPFIYGLPDYSFDESQYALRVVDGEIDLELVCSWFNNLELSKDEIRSDAERFRWEYQFERVLSALSALEPRVHDGGVR